jgi:hypothetical protein
MSNEQYRVLLKNLTDESNLNFLYNLNIIIKDNLIADFDVDHFTIIDRFIIATYLKIHAVGKDLQLQRKCSKCSSDTKLFLDLENMLIFLSDKIDKSFRSEISIEDYPVSIICDVPSIKKEYSNLLLNADLNIDTRSTDYRLHSYMISFISSIIIGDKEHILDELNIDQQNALLSRIPYKVMEKIKTAYITNIHNIFDKVIFFKFHCGKCSEEFELKLQSDNINEMTKLVFRDSSLDVFLRDYFSVSSHSHLDGSFLNKLSYSEIKVLTQFVEMSHQSQSTEPPSNGLSEGADLFGDYNAEVAHMARTPSDL